MNEVEELLNDVENDENEELSVEEKKKAINLQDLIYIKKYINKRHKNYTTETDAKYEAFTDTITAEHDHFKDEYEKTTSDLQETYDEFMANAAAGIDAKAEEAVAREYSNITDQLTKIKNGSITVGKATDTTTVQGVNFADDGATTFGEYIYCKKKLMWSGQYQMTYDDIVEKAFLLTEDVPLDLLKAIDGPGKYIIVGSENGDPGSSTPHQLFECEVIVGSYDDGKRLLITSANIFRINGVTGFTPDKLKYVHLAFTVTGGINIDTSGNILLPPYKSNIRIMPIDYSTAIYAGVFPKLYMRAIYKIVE